MESEYNLQFNIFLFISLIYFFGIIIYKTYTDKLPSILSIISQIGFIHVSAVIIILFTLINVKMTWIILIIILLINLISMSILFDGF
jgi:hypothetical protein